MVATLEPQAKIGKAAIGALGALALALGTLQAVVEPSLPMLQHDLGIGPAAGSLIFITLLITGAVVAPIAGKLGDRYGGKRVLVVLMTAVSAGGLLSSVAPNLPVLLLGQVLQGAMVGALPLSFILVRKHLPPGRTQVAVGVVSGLFTGGGLVGMLSAGPIAEHLSRHWMFAIPTIAIIAATLTVARLMPDDPPAESDARIDWLGVILLSCTLVGLVLGFTAVTGGGLPPLASAGVIVVVAALATGWVLVERRAASPMVDLRMLAMPAVWSAGVVTLLMSLGLGMAVYLVPQLLSAPASAYGFGADPSEIGVFLVPATVAGVVAGTVAGIAARRFGPRAVVTAGAAATAAALIALGPLHDATWQLVAARALIGFAVSVSAVALLAGTATAVDAKDTGIATSLLVVTRVIGVAIGAQTAGAILDAGTDPATGLPAESSFTTGFVTAGLIAAASLLAVRAMKKGTQS
ncbi:MFS transporter [Glycomyces terrestris]|uniref:MFS transporter n=1 Tax=Glycomyces terrestris TaxID=2493553 RepID=A0A426URX6_9ACTN|nr:MFS transporter [Glycomyces terrestris]RRR95838.1 MFS transporter [Glycomyces terrestris]